MPPQDQKSAKPERTPKRKDSDELSEGVPGERSREHHPAVPDSGRPTPDDPRSDEGNEQAPGGR